MTDIVNLWLGSQFGLQYFEFVRPNKFRNLALRIIEITENPCSAHTGIYTRRYETFSDPMHTQAALICTTFVRIDESLLVRTSCYTQFATNALLVTYLNCIISIIMGCSCRTDTHTRSVPAVVAKFWQEAPSHVCICSMLFDFDPGAPYTQRRTEL
jgi:hypothetical protein